MFEISVFLSLKNVTKMNFKVYLAMMVALGAAGCGGQSQVNTQKPPVRVAVQTAGGDNVASFGRTFTGIVEENQAVAVSFTTMGVVKNIPINEGMQVSKGQLIAQIDDTQAQNLLTASKAAAQQADDALSRYKILHDKGSMSEVQWVEILSKTAQAKAQLEGAQKNLDDCTLRAPQGGIIGKKFVGAGETALPSQPVATILDINTVKIKVAIPEKEISDINSDTKSNINVEAAGVSINGGKIEKGIVADALTHTYDIRISVNNPNHKLLPGMAAQVSFDINNNTQNSITLPVTAVQKRFDGSLFVWIVGDDKTVKRAEVKTGSMVGNDVVITSGISAGNIIVTEGYQKLSEGVKVVY